jgi:hypothetical protein
VSFLRDLWVRIEMAGRGAGHFSFFCAQRILSPILSSTGRGSWSVSHTVASTSSPQGGDVGNQRMPPERGLVEEDGLVALQPVVMAHPDGGQPVGVDDVHLATLDRQPDLVVGPAQAESPPGIMCSARARGVRFRTPSKQPGAYRALIEIAPRRSARSRDLNRTGNGDFT